MKKFKQLLEDIELVSGHPRTTKRDMQDAQMDFEDNAEFRKNLGKIHKDYSLHRSGRDFWITHDPSSKVVGHIDTEPSGESGGGKKLHIAQLNIDRNHTKKNIGHSLAVAAYKQLWRTGHTINSGSDQSIGGASVWNDLINDPETQNHVHAVYSVYGERGTQLGLAKHLNPADIWISGSREARTAARRKGIKMHDYYSSNADYTQHVKLVLKPKVKKNK